MARSKKVVLEFEADTSQVTQSVEEVESSVDGLSSSVDNLTGGLASGFSQGVAGAKKMVTGMRTLKGAIAATGVGLLVTAIGSLVSYFQTTEKGAGKLQTAMSFLEIMFKKLTDLVNPLGEAIVAAFEDPQQAVKDLWEAIKENITTRMEGMMKQFLALGKILNGVFKLDWEQITEGASELGTAFVQTVTGTEDFLDKASEFFSEVITETKEAVKQAERYANAMTATQNLIQKLTVDNAKLNAEIETQQKIIDDTTRSYAEREAALKLQNEATEQLAVNVAKQAAAEESLLRQEIALTANYQEREELETQLSEKQAERIEAEKAIQIVRLENAQKTREIELEELERQRSIFQTIQDLRTENIEDENQKFFEQLAIQEERTIQELEQLRATEEEKQAVRDEFAAMRAAKELELQTKLDQEQEAANKKALAEEKQLQQKKVEIAQNAAAALTGLISALSSDSEAGARRQFRINKALGIASATVNTAQAVAAALTAGGNPLKLATGQQFVEAGIAAAQGAAQIATIAKTKFQSTGGGGSGVNLPSTPSSGGGGATVPTLDFSFLEQGANQSAIQSYVLSTDVSNSMEATQLIQDQAKL